MKLCISLPDRTCKELIYRVTELRKEKPSAEITVSGTINQHLEYAFKKPLCEVIEK